MANWYDLAGIDAARMSEVTPMDENTYPITVFYDGACPSCVRDRRTYERWAGAAGTRIAWFDITGQEERLRELGIDPRKALTELHVMDERRHIRSELDAYILLLEQVPWLRPLAWLISRPVIRPGLARLYHRAVDRRLRRSGRLECGGGICRAAGHPPDGRDICRPDQPAGK